MISPKTKSDYHQKKQQRTTMRKTAKPPEGKPKRPVGRPRKQDKKT